MKRVTVAALQSGFSDDLEANVRRVSELVEEAAGRGAQVVLPPEPLSIFSKGISDSPPSSEKRFWPRKFSCRNDSKTSAWRSLRTCSRPRSRRSAAICFSSVENCQIFIASP